MVPTTTQQVKQNGCSKMFLGKRLSDLCPATCKTCVPGCGDFDNSAFVKDRAFCSDASIALGARCGGSYFGEKVSDMCPGTCNSCPEPVNGPWFNYAEEHTGGSLNKPQTASTRFTSVATKSTHLFYLPAVPCQTVTVDLCKAECNKYQACKGIHLSQDLNDAAVRCVGLSDLGVGSAPCTDAFCLGYSRSYYGPPLGTGLLPGEKAGTPVKFDFPSGQPRS